MTCSLRLAAIWLLAVAGMGPAARADELSEKLAQLMDAPPYEQAHWGALFVDQETGETLYERQSRKLFAPASVTKLYTVAAALDAFGADHRFKTPVYRRGELADGLLKGDLILVPSGDLTLGGRTTASGEIAFQNSDHTYANYSDDGGLTEQDPLAGLHELARQAAAAGLKKLDGDVIIDDRLFAPIESTGSGPRTVQPVLLNDNLIDFLITPGEEGEPATVVVRPESKLIQVTSNVKTGEKSASTSITIRGGNGQYTVSGTIPAGRKPLVRQTEMDDAPAMLRGLFLEALRKAGVETTAEPAIAASPKDLPRSDEYAGLTKIAELTSPPFAENAKLVLKVSHNLHASALPLLVDLRNGGKGTLAGGLRRHRECFERLGVETGQISFGGGAGGARADYVTPAATVQLLRGMTKHKDFAAYERALPILGVDGTLASIGKGGPLQDKLRAKTGTLTWDNTLGGNSLLQSKALAGYMTTKQGKKVIFAVFVNGVPMKEGVTTRRIGSDLVKVCELIYEAN